MSDSRRAKRIASLIQAEISRALVEDVADPSLDSLVIHDVDLSPDLKNARVFYATPGAIPEKDIQQGFRRAIPYFKKRLGANLGLRVIPQLKFEKDSLTDSVTRIYSLLDEVKRGATE